MNAKISVFVICVETMIYLLYKLHDCIFNEMIKDAILLELPLASDQHILCLAFVALMRVFKYFCYFILRVL